MTTEKQLHTVQGHIQDALNKGAHILAQSNQQNKKHKLSHPATVLINVDHSMKVMQEETFGPVLCIMKIDNIEEGIKLANDSDLALTSSIWTKNKSKAISIAKKIHSGVTTINDHLYTHGLSETPWGGWKNLGWAEHMDSKDLKK